MSDSEYIKQAEDVFREAIDITRSIDGWKVEKEDKANNLIVEMKKNAHGRKIYRCKVLLLSYLNFIFTPFCITFQFFFVDIWHNIRLSFVLVDKNISSTFYIH